MTPKEHLRRVSTLDKAARAGWRDASRLLLGYLQRQAYRAIETGGASTGKAWNFGTEPKYNRAKLRRWGVPTGDMPLTTPNVLDAFEKGWGMSKGVARHRLRMINAKQLIRTGGVGPFGEPFPARNPYALTPAQKAEMTALITDALSAALRKHLTIRGGA